MKTKTTFDVCFTYNRIIYFMGKNEAGLITVYSTKHNQPPISDQLLPFLHGLSQSFRLGILIDPMMNTPEYTQHIAAKVMERLRVISSN